MKTPAARHNAGAPVSATPAAASERAHEPQEIELKLSVPEAYLPPVRQRLDAFGSGSVDSLESVYFDTRDRLLAKQGAALRVRRVGRGAQARWVQTLKTEGKVGVLTRRGEWEGAVPDRRVHPDLLADSPLTKLLQGDAPDALRPIFCTRFERTVRRVNIQDSLIELALDDGRVVAAGRVEPIREIELELLRGDPQDLYRLALQLIGSGRQALPLLPALESKAKRGYRLAGGSGMPAAPVRAEAGDFARLARSEQTAEQVARGVLAHGLHLVLLNAPGAASSGDAEYVHQARIALRRARSALRLLGQAAGPGRPLLRELHWICGLFGSVRDWDVMLSETLPAMQRRCDEADALLWQRVMERAQARRERQRLRLRDAIDGPRFARAILRLLQWADSSAATRPTRWVIRAQWAVEQCFATLGAKANHVAALSPVRRHRLRILAKRQRYALEFLADWLPAEQCKRPLKQLARLQQLLGEVNDAHVAITMLRSLTRSQAVLQQGRDWVQRVQSRNLPEAQRRLQRLPKSLAAV